MKTLSKLVFFVPFFASMALAMPEVHDFAKFEGVSTPKEGGPLSWVLERTLGEYLPETDEFVDTVVLWAGGQKMVQSTLRSRGDFLSDQRVEEILNDCDTIGEQGTIQVGAGTFEVCKVFYEEGGSQTTTWYGRVPFGVVKMASQDENSSSEQELVEYSFGGGQ